MPEITDQGVQVNIQLIADGISFLKDELRRRPNESQAWKIQINRTITTLEVSYNFVWAMAAKGAINE